MKKLLLLVAVAFGAKMIYDKTKGKSNNQTTSTPTIPSSVTPTVSKRNYESIASSTPLHVDEQLPTNRSTASFE